MSQKWNYVEFCVINKSPAANENLFFITVLTKVQVWVFSYVRGMNLFEIEFFSLHSFVANSLWNSRNCPHILLLK